MGQNNDTTEHGDLQGQQGGMTDRGSRKEQRPQPHPTQDQARQDRAREKLVEDQTRGSD